MLKKLMQQMYQRAVALNADNIISLVLPNQIKNILDLGCGDGQWSLALAKKAGVKQIYGIEIIDEQIKKAKKNIKVIKSDLNADFPFEDNSFDLIHANQVIEHIADLDHFVKEIYRVLRKGGYAIISTENQCSWHNIMAMILGWQMFSLTNVSNKQTGIGNPLALHRGESGTFASSSWTHKTIMSLKGLKELFAIHNFREITAKGAGYYPLPSNFGNLDKNHSHFITIRAFK